VTELHTPEYKKLRKLLIETRKKSEITQQDVADALGKPQSFVAKYECGERRLDVIEFIKISKIIGLSYKKFLKLYDQ